MVPLAEETGVQADVRKPPKRTDDIENGLNLMKLKKALDFSSPALYLFRRTYG